MQWINIFIIIIVMLVIKRFLSFETEEINSNNEISTVRGNVTIGKRITNNIRKK
jgi:hypothetical protein